MLLLTRNLGKLGDRVSGHHEESDSSCSTDTVTFLAYPPANASSWTLHRQSGLAGSILRAQYHGCQKRNKRTMSRLLTELQLCRTIFSHVTALCQGRTSGHICYWWWSLTWKLAQQHTARLPHNFFSTKWLAVRGQIWKRHRFNSDARIACMGPILRQTNNISNFSACPPILLMHKLKDAGAGARGRWVFQITLPPGMVFHCWSIAYDPLP